jgi:hypothetical protein
VLAWLVWCYIVALAGWCRCGFWAPSGIAAGVLGTSWTFSLLARTTCAFARPSHQASSSMQLGRTHRRYGGALG